MSSIKTFNNQGRFIAFFCAEMFRIPGTRRETAVYYANTGFFYHCSYVTATSVYFKCIVYDGRCRGRGILHRNGQFEETGYHNHLRDGNNFLLRRLMRSDILRSVRQNPHLSFRDIVRIEGERYPQDVRSVITVNRMRSAMHRMRMLDFPHIPDTLLELSNLLQDPQYAHITMGEDQSSIHAATVEASDGSTHLIFISERMMNSMQEVRWLFADGHFASTPVRPQCSQIVNLVTVCDHHAILLGSVLMESRTEQAYRAVFGTMKQLMPNLSPEYIMTDFETAQQSAWRWAFPEAIILGCFWHFCRAVVRKAQNLGLMRWLRRSRLIRRLLRICCSIALLPSPLLIHGWFEAAVECHRYGPFVFNLFSPLLNYLYTSWVTHPTRSLAMSVYNSVHRTNNVCESTNRWMRHEVGAHHPNPYSLIGVFRRMEGMAYTCVFSLMHSMQPARARHTSAVANDQRLQHLYRQLHERPFGIRFAIRNILYYGDNTFRHAFNDLIHHDNDEDL